jgi:hypothetical protein
VTDYWKTARKVRKLYKRRRRDRAACLLPQIRQLCESAGIEMLKVEHGWQFRRDEYVINWSPSTNRVQVQYALPGHGDTVPFIRRGEVPRIVIALKEVAEIAKREGRLRQGHGT